jgi:hypothetical protein
MPRNKLIEEWIKLRGRQSFEMALFIDFKAWKSSILRFHFSCGVMGVLVWVDLSIASRKRGYVG